MRRTARYARHFSGVLPGASYEERGYAERDYHVFSKGEYSGRLRHQIESGRASKRLAYTGRAHQHGREFGDREVALRWLRRQITLISHY